MLGGSELEVERGMEGSGVLLVGVVSRLVPGTSYEFRVTAVNGATRDSGVGMASAPVTEQTQSGKTTAQSSPSISFHIITNSLSMEIRIFFFQPPHRILSFPLLALSLPLFLLRRMMTSALWPSHSQHSPQSTAPSGEDRQFLLSLGLKPGAWIPQISF